MNATKWDAAAEYTGADDWIAMTEIGLDYLVAYHAPDGNLARSPLPPELRTGRHGMPLGDSDRETLDEDTDQYLADAGVPAPPRDFRWYVRRPHRMTDKQFFDRMYSAVHADWPDDNRPNHHLLPLERAYVDLYSDDV